MLGCRRPCPRPCPPPPPCQPHPNLRAALLQVEALGSGIGVKSCVLVGGIDMMAQAIALAKRPHVLVGTPGRVVDHLSNTKVRGGGGGWGRGGGCRYQSKLKRTQCKEQGGERGLCKERGGERGL